MTLKERTDKVKAFLKLVFEDVPAGGETGPADLAKDYETSSGAHVMIDKLEIGGKVYDADGVTPVVVGFTLADGTQVAVDETGTITAVTTAAAPAGDYAAPEANPLEARIVALESELAALKAGHVQQFADQEAAYKAQRTKDGEALQKVVELVESFAAQPSADPAETPSDKTGGETPKPTKAERRAELAVSMAEILKK